MTKVHVIIDMQYFFFSNYNFETLLKERITKYIRKNTEGLYIVVKYKGLGKTFKSIMNSFSKHDVIEVTKDTDSGSNNVITALKQKGIDVKNVDYSIMGVNTNYCVASTIRGLLQTGALNSLRVDTSMIGNAWDDVIGDPNLCLGFMKGQLVKTRVIKESQFEIID